MKDTSALSGKKTLLIIVLVFSMIAAIAGASLLTVALRQARASKKEDLTSGSAQTSYAVADYSTGKKNLVMYI